MHKLLPLLAIICISCLSDQGKRDDFFIQGNEALGTGEFETAIEHYTNAIQIDGEFDEALNNRGVALIESGHPHEAIIDYNLALQIDPAYDECRLNRAYAYEQIGQFQNAFDDIDMLVNESPDSAYLHFYHGLVLSKMKKFEASLNSFKTAINLGDVSADALVNIATLHYFTGRFDLAKQYIDQAFELEPQQPNGYNTLSQVLLAEGDKNGALFSIGRALELVPREPYFLNNRGLVYLEMDSLELGLKDINRSILLNPDNGWAYRNKGIYYSKKGNLKKAIEMFERSIDSHEFIDEVYYYLGKTYLEVGDGAKACEAWKNGLANGERRCEVMAIACI